MMSRHCHYFLQISPVIRGVVAVVSLLAAGSSNAYLVTITAGVQSLYLQVGVGTVTGGNFNAGGTPANNGTINRVTVTVPAANLGSGSQAMNTDSPVTASPFDGFTFCAIPSQVYVGGFYRTPGAGAAARLSAAVPTALINASGDSIPFNAVSWVSGGIGDNPATIPSGTFAGGTTQTLFTVARNNWFESCLQFNYANNQLVPAGTFNGRVTYTLTLP